MRLRIRRRCKPSETFSLAEEEWIAHGSAGLGATTRLAAEADDLEQRYVAQRERAERAEAAADALLGAVEDYLLWEPGRKGHAAAHRRLVAAAREARS